MNGNKFCNVRGGLVAQVGQDEREVARFGIEGGLKRAHRIGAGRRGGQPRTEIPQHRELPFADDPFGHLGDHAQHSGCHAVLACQRRVGEGVVGLLRETASLEVKQQRLVPRCPTRLEDMPNPWTDVRPNLRPDLI